MGWQDAPAVQAKPKWQDAPPAQQPAMPPEGGMSWGDVGSQAMRNLGPSARQFGEDIVYPFMHPIDTAKGLGNLGLGVAEKVIPGEQSHEQYADAMGKFFVDRYGGMENLKKTMAEDPVGFLADVSTVVTGGAGLAAKGLGTASKAGRVATAIAHPVRQLGKGAAEVVGALGTHTGGTSLRTAAAAGAKGGAASKAFRRAITGTAPVDEVVNDARKAVRVLRERKNAAYRFGMKGVAQDQTVLDFGAVDRAAAKAAGVKKYKGVPISRKTEGIRKEINDVLDEWRSLDPAEYHTPEGMDALKQAIGEIRDSTDFHTPNRVVADQVYNAVKDQITKQAPAYAETMRGYSDAMETIRDLEKSLSLGEKAASDTALRKLQSIMRNNAFTNYGRRAALGQLLVDAGAEHLMEKLAGQSLTAIHPRGLGGAVAGATGVGGLALDPRLLATLPLQSPRIMGEAAYGLGALSRLAPPPGTAAAVYQAGRGARTSDPRGRR